MKEYNVVISNSHVNNLEEITDTSVINFIQDIEGIHINSLTKFNNYMKQNNIGVFLTYRQIDIINRPKLFEEIKLTTYPYNTNQISGYRHIYIKDKYNNNLITSTAFGVFVNLENEKVERLPKEIINSINDKKQDENIKVYPRKIKVNQKNKKLLEKIEIKRSYIDRYNHMNNSYYVRLTFDHLNSSFLYNKIRVEYKKAFKQNDICYIYKNLEDKNKVIFTLENKNNEIYCIVEYSI